MAVFEILLRLAVFDFIERRLRDVDVAAFDQVRHLTIKEGQEQSSDVGAVDVGVGHDDDAVVAQFVGVEVVAAHALADTRAERGDQRQDLVAGQQLLVTRTLDIQDLAAQRQDRLELAIAALLGRAPGGVTLDDVDFAKGRIFFLTVSQLARQAHAVQHALAPGHLPGLARRFAGSRCIDDLAADDLGVDRVLQQIVGKRLADHVFDRASYLR